MQHCNLLMAIRGNCSDMDSKQTQHESIKMIRFLLMFSLLHGQGRESGINLLIILYRDTLVWCRRRP